MGTCSRSIPTWRFSNAQRASHWSGAIRNPFKPGRKIWLGFSLVRYRVIAAQNSCDAHGQSGCVWDSNSCSVHDAFSGGASLSRVLARFSVCMNAPFSVRWTENTGRFLLLAGLLYPAGAVAVESGRGNRRPGEEYGSARWGDPRAIGKKYRDRGDRENNFLLTQHVALCLDGRIS